MKYSGVGGQAVMEGILMRNADRVAIAIRKTDGEIELKEEKYRTVGGSDRLRKIPFVRGPFLMIDSLKLGLGAIQYSASFFMEEEEEKQSFLEKHFSKETADTITTVLTVVLALGLALALFLVLPVLIAGWLRPLISSRFGISLIEGLLRVGIFLLYVWLISRMKDIRRVFMYHGAEHKCINCIEHGLPLNVGNVRVSSRFHKRCGTSFLFFVMIISIFVSIFLPTEVIWQRLLTRLLLLPVVVSLSYEFIRLAGSSDNPVSNALSQPGLWVQRLTTREPEDDMIEVGITSVEAVFDWKTWQETVLRSGKEEKFTGEMF
ncbi:MAG: DUF1385 domain-containing protein [Lachnospiraceae bacterium]|nr:DUF1385 domain-containing protein [Lachnospiraceae bacterium]